MRRDHGIAPLLLNFWLRFARIDKISNFVSDFKEDMSAAAGLYVVVCGSNGLARRRNCNAGTDWHHWLLEG